MPRILIAGCGYVGEATADLFHAAGWNVEGWVHSAQSAAAFAAKPYRVSAVDISQSAEVSEHAGGFDAIVHCASSRGGDAEMYRRIYFNGARNLLNSFPAAKILFTSSTSVYAQHDGSRVTEESETKPIRETSRILLEVEKLVLDRAVIVARLAGIYGPGRSALLSKFLERHRDDRSENNRFVNQVHRDDIVSALFLSVKSRTAGRVRRFITSSTMNRFCKTTAISGWRKVESISSTDRAISAPNGNVGIPTNG